MSKASQRRHSDDRFLQKIYEAGHKLGRQGVRHLPFKYKYKRVQNKYVLGWKHGLGSRTKAIILVNRET